MEREKERKTEEENDRKRDKNREREGGDKCFFPLHCGESQWMSVLTCTSGD